MKLWMIICGYFFLSFCSFDKKQKTECYHQEFEIKDKAVLEKIGTFVKKVETYALPVISIQNVGDSSFVYVSATIAANSLLNTPPSYIANFQNKEIAVYNGKSPLQGECLLSAVAHYREKLQIDLSNKKEGQPAGNPVYYIYDGVAAKIALVNHKIVLVDNSFQSIATMPYFKPSH